MSEGSYSTYEVRHRAVDALRRGLLVQDVSVAFGVDRTTLYRWRSRYEADDEVGLQRKPGSGRPRTLDGLGEDVLRSIVLQPASAFGFETDLWTVGRLHQVIRGIYEH